MTVYHIKDFQGKEHIVGSCEKHESYVEALIQGNKDLNLIAMEYFNNRSFPFLRCDICKSLKEGDLVEKKKH